MTDPWPIGEYNDTGGYDCMYGAIKVGPVTLDGQDYGQNPCVEISPEGLEKMKKDARTISLLQS